MKRITIEQSPTHSERVYPNGELVIRTPDMDKIIAALHPPMGYDEEIEVWEEPSVDAPDEEFEK